MIVKDSERVDVLRRSYPNFVYKSFSVNRIGSQLIAEFEYILPPDISFRSRLTFANLPPQNAVPSEVIDNLIFHVGLAESFSYWKATCSPTIEIKAGTIDRRQIEWWNELLRKGMGEYFFVNRIPFQAPKYISMECTAPSRPVVPAYGKSLRRGLLIPLGGGRDSAVAAKLSQKQGVSPGYMILNAIPSAFNVSKALGCDDPIRVERLLDPLLLILNDRGFLNGHVPFSASLAFISAVCLALYGYSVIGIANEKSSNEGNVEYAGTIVNHQYSKTEEFETSFNQYLRDYLLKHATYLSLIRPLYELQIGRIFSGLRSLHGIVSSCNRLQREGRWCGECPKCLSVLITTYPFVEPKDLSVIFHSSNFFDRESSIPIVRELVGLENHKPFECVAGIDETIGALFLCVALAESRKEAPLALRYVRNEILPIFPDAESYANRYLGQRSFTESLPTSVEAALKEELSAQ